MTVAAEKPAVRPDGRRLRAERTRAAIVDSLLALVDEGNLQPTAQEVADRAGVALRSIAQHFPTRDELLLAGAGKHAERAADLHAPVTTTGTRALRIAAFVKARANYLEATSGVRRAAMLHLGQRNRDERAAGERVIVAAFHALSRIRRDEVAAAFAKEIGDDEDKLESLHVAASGAVWDAMRRDLGLTRKLAERRVSALLDALTR